MWDTLDSVNKTYPWYILITIYDTICFGCVKERVLDTFLLHDRTLEIWLFDLNTLKPVLNDKWANTCSQRKQLQLSHYLYRKSKVKSMRTYVYYFNWTWLDNKIF